MMPKDAHVHMYKAHGGTVYFLRVARAARNDLLDHHLNLYRIIWYCDMLRYTILTYHGLVPTFWSPGSFFLFF